jgi:hypothetical protein
MESIQADADYTVTRNDHGTAIVLGGNALTTLTFLSADEYGIEHDNTIINSDAGRMKYVNVTGEGRYRLYPRQIMMVVKLRKSWVVHRPGRWRLEANPTIFWAAPDGSADNDGLAPNSPLPVADALNRIKNDLDMNGKLTILRLADGIWGALPHIAGHWTGSHTMEIHGNPEAPTVVVAPGAGETGLYVTDYARCVVRHVHFAGQPMTTTALVKSEQLSVIGLANCSFRNAANMILSLNNGNIRFNASCTFGGSCAVALMSYARGRIELGAANYIIDGAMSFSYFAGCSLHSTIAANPGARFSGSGSGMASAGKKYELAGLSAIHSGGGGPDLFPGNQSGAQDATSAYF